MMMKFCALLLFVHAFTIFINPSEASGTEKHWKDEICSKYCPSVCIHGGCEKEERCEYPCNKYYDQVYFKMYCECREKCYKDCIQNLILEEYCNLHSIKNLTMKFRLDECKHIEKEKELWKGI
ncbi:unnamed protein product [Trichobilharzia szidati]|nr:unnamed protein product [Trichobilharzia szidati]